VQSVQIHDTVALIRAARALFHGVIHNECGDLSKGVAADWTTATNVGGVEPNAVATPGSWERGM
jgi:hypothetical protein